MSSLLKVYVIFVWGGVGGRAMILDYTQLSKVILNYMR